MASCTNASCVRVRSSKSFARRRQRPSQPNVRSTIQRLGSATKPKGHAASEREVASHRDADGLEDCGFRQCRGLPAAFEPAGGA
jgi:hypothetical protein